MYVNLPLIIACSRGDKLKEKLSTGMFNMGLDLIRLGKTTKDQKFKLSYFSAIKITDQIFLIFSKILVL